MQVSFDKTKTYRRSFMEMWIIRYVMQFINILQGNAENVIFNKKFRQHGIFHFEGHQFWSKKFIRVHNMVYPNVDISKTLKCTQIRELGLNRRRNSLNTNKQEISRN